MSDRNLLRKQNKPLDQPVLINHFVKERKWLVGLHIPEQNDLAYSYVLKIHCPYTFLHKTQCQRKNKRPLQRQSKTDRGNLLFTCDSLDCNWFCCFLFFFKEHWLPLCFILLHWEHIILLKSYFFYIPLYFLQPFILLHVDSLLLKSIFFIGLEYLHSQG